MARTGRIAAVMTGLALGAGAGVAAGGCGEDRGSVEVEGGTTGTVGTSTTRTTGTTGAAPETTSTTETSTTDSGGSGY